MKNKKRWLSFVLEDDCLFEELVSKFSRLFNKHFSIIDDEGRYIASADAGIYTVNIIDKIDRLSDYLCDDNYVFEVIIRDDALFNLKFEDEIKNILSKGNVKWERFVWAPEGPE
ncbi:hypothetical protein ACLF30_003749 [Cronobacter sakazakii]|uniref:hypothetical protein n=2 Tax=Cronobacter sakazakii TaxID=28141 RepID=UPI0010163E6F|nr:hypothetical protein [Cronobacter sakazakii]EJC1154361.1 hypothetical protein [Cronobacter sakazakii]EJC1182919.1 hypothetical protein [Cronobacter sakazakii]EJC1242617.1 hypothetical protein [Cronobacter sakazakii]EJC2074182.1 hypothetical protein [Cronobacter sakazakii]EJQ2009518.1 hypothetical protein [Cronobacter sakazakii]